MKQEKMFHEALEYAKSKGHRIIRGPLFDWTQDPPHCDACGAVLLLHQKEDLVRNKFDPTWLNVLCFILEVDRFWLRRFWLGFDCGFQVEFHEFNDKGKIIKTSLDDISTFGIKLSKKYCK